MTTAAEFLPIGQRLQDLATERGDAPALTVVAPDASEQTLSWVELDQRSNALARAVAARGLAPGDRIALELKNSVELILGVLAAWKTGTVPVPMRWDLPDWERARLIEVVAPRLTLSADTLPDLVAEAATQSTEPLPVVVGPQLNGICSSGSTGMPKVILADRPAVWTPEASMPFAASWGPIPLPQTILVPAPMYHTNGFSTLQSLLGGDRLVVLQKFDAVLIVDLIERHRITNFTATPTMLQRIARVPDVDQRDLSSIVWILQGAAVLPPALARRWFELIGPEKVIMAYGMTEALGLTALRGDEWLAHPGSVGRGFRDTEIRILGADGRELPTGELGEIYLKSPTTGFYTYLGGAPLLPTTADGFGTAGDLGHVDEDGYLYIADRRVDLIISGGANVFPAEVESALAEHPAIADVVVVGLADEEWGRRVHAIVEPSDPTAPPSDADVIAFAKQRLAAYKVPKTVELVDSIPRSAAMKVSRSALVAERDPAGVRA